MPVSANDRMLIEQAFETTRMNVPLITHPIAERRVFQYVVGFDGTMNDRLRVPVGEKETIVASLMTKLGGTYYPGPGMQHPRYRNVIDGMIGYSSANIAETAAVAFLAQAQRWIETAPDGEVRVVVTGFSRGAAIARHFMNLVDSAADKSPALRRRVYFYVLLFDTVSTGQLDSLELALPASVDYFVHLVARDEPRFLFEPVVDSKPKILTKVFKLGGIPIPERINMIWLPGAHSDIGASYMGGIGSIYRQLVEQLLYEMGLSTQNCWETLFDHALAGKHDSRGLFDRFTGTPPPNSAATVLRSQIEVPFTNPGIERADENAKRLSEMLRANVERGLSISRFSNEISPPRFTLHRRGESISVVDWEPSEYIDGSSFEFDHADGVKRLTYRFLPPYQNSISTLVLSGPIWDHLPEDRPAVLSYSILSQDKLRRIVAFVDDVQVSSVVSTSNDVGIGPKSERTFKCVMDENGTPRSPMQMYIIQPNVNASGTTGSR